MQDELQAKVKTLNELMWEGRFPWSDIERWLKQFAPHPDTSQSERLHALFLLSHFSYFNSDLMRVLLRSLYRDFVQYPIVADLRRRRRDTLDWATLAPHYDNALKSVRFVGVGNPSESGTHLLYYFRQENQLSTKLFLHPHELFDDRAATPRLIQGVRHVIFLDDFCGSGTQAARYSRLLIPRIRDAAKRVRLSYYPLFATSAGLKAVRNKELFTDVETPCELDDSFRALDATSRYFREPQMGLSREFAAEMCAHYGQAIEPTAALGFGGCQLLFGFAHNIPNNTLPIFWSDGQQGAAWTPIFRRWTKQGGW